MAIYYEKQSFGNRSHKTKIKDEREKIDELDIRDKKENQISASDVKKLSYYDAVSRGLIDFSEEE